MFCDSCGAQITTGQSFCQRCGKAIVGSVQPGSSRVARHAQLLGILWIAYSAFSALVGFGIFFFVHRMMPFLIRMQPPAGGPPPEIMLGFMRPFMIFICLLLIAKGAVGAVAGAGLLQRAEWSRMLAIVVGCVSLLNAPFGTAIGIYTLWVLLSPNADLEFREGRTVAA